MIDKIIEFSLNNRLIIGILTLALMAWGAYNFTQLPIDAVPDITNNQVQIITTSPSLAPQEIEQFITFPVEIAMANLQGVTEIRSISRFGLSVVTVVFKDNIDPYRTRQMVGEQIMIAEGNIPTGYGKPEMMPITTGLGEIYQYVVEPEPGFEDRYSPMDIRTVQDWIIKRQLSGIPGIVEINSFGGFLKQYQVTIEPRTLVGMDITILEIFDALEQNNQNTGGSYIEKGPNAFYIRAEGLVKNKEDIENIVIKNIKGVPILIKDVAAVTFGAPVRFGAMTKDGKGEAVGGITLMLRGANSAQVINDVKTRIAKVQEILPKGLVIHPYLDRSALIMKTVNTVSKNLIEGGIIVILVLMLLVGNLRASLIVASVIPLSMLFAFSLMNIFGVSANLMSLGAVDFGLIVDGSVIVVEGILHRLDSKYKTVRLSQEEMNLNISTAAMRVGKSAVFGVFIILIVYIPIFVFTGIEGKMFKPMAQTVSFALLGALILSLTYVPMMASLFLNKNLKHKKTISDRLVGYLEKAHAPVLDWSLRHKALLISGVIIFMTISFYIFSRMGGEFIPTLEEGDLAAQMTLTPGSSLTESVNTTTKVEKILLENFPEVKSVVSKIGTAEVPTDPMAMEDADIMIILKNKEEWTSASTREELADKMKQALSVLPGVSFEFQQPIQLRFNELMTGVKSDVAVKIYGEDLTKLYELGNSAASFIQDVPGAGDVKVEQVIGLPQLVVRYKRDKLAQYNLTIDEINKIIRTAFAGEAAGVIFEGERRFDLVVRLKESYRKNIGSLRNLAINRPADQLVLLSQVADITFEKGPLQISRDDTKRRITIGVNIRNRDVQSFVEEIRQVLQEKQPLPPGYYYTYGGQFENLQAAQKSSSVAVPVALAAIFVLLYFAFYSLRQATMIFTAIPLAAIGGIWALYLRGMPFSISGGVGFIALFGVAVLNGIVLISYYNQLDKEGMTDIYERVKVGTRQRLRPVIMTAAVAALGFFPMALSNAPGAEVQRPLATVVIGGLVTATFLTLVLLPVFYVLFSKKKKTAIPKSNYVTVILILIFAGIFSSSAYSQQQAEKLSLEQALSYALERNYHIKDAAMQLDAAGKLKKSAVDLPAPEINWTRGQINSSLQDNHLLISQRIHFPAVYSAQHRIQSETENYARNNYQLARKKLERDVKAIYYYWQMLYHKKKVLIKQDSIYQDFRKSVEVQYRVGDVNQITLLTAQTRSMAMSKLMNDVKAEISYTEDELKRFMNVEGNYIPERDSLQKLFAPVMTDTSWLISNPILLRFENEIDIMKAKQNREKMMAFPDLNFGYFDQSIDSERGFRGWILGISVPIWFWSYSGKIQSAKVHQEIAKNNLLLERQYLITQAKQLYIQLGKNEYALRYYEENALLQAGQLIKNTVLSYSQGEIDYLEYVQNTTLAFEIQLQYLDALNDFNQTIIEIQYFTQKM